MTIALKIEDVSKMYRLGTVGTGTLSHDLNRWWATLRGKPDPALKIGATNDRTESGGEHVWALKDINLEVEQGEILGIIGRNGAGKSTLLKLLSRVTAPTTGSIKSRGRIASLLEVGTGFHPELTGRENVYLNGAIMGMTRPEVTKRLDEIVEFSGCAKYIDTPVKRYSSGMTVRLGFAVAAHLDCEILIVDEVLAVGDAEFQRKCIGKMQEVGAESGKTILFVSHNMESVTRLCSRVALVEQGMVVSSGESDLVVTRYLNQRNLGPKRIGLPVDLVCGLSLNDFALKPTSPTANEPLQVELSIRASGPTEITELAVFFESLTGQRVAVVDFRSEEGATAISPSKPFSKTASIRAIPFVDNVYDVGIYVRSRQAACNLHGISQLVVSTPDDGRVPYPRKARGLVELDCKIIDTNA